MTTTTTINATLAYQAIYDAQQQVRSGGALAPWQFVGFIQAGVFYTLSNRITGPLKPGANSPKCRLVAHWLPGELWSVVPGDNFRQQGLAQLVTAAEFNAAPSNYLADPPQEGEEPPESTIADMRQEILDRMDQDAIDAQSGAGNNPPPHPTPQDQTTQGYAVDIAPTVSNGSQPLQFQ